MPQAAPDITALVTTFATQLTAAVEQSVATRVRAAVARLTGASFAPAFGSVPKRRGPGRPPKNGFALAAAAKPKKPVSPQVAAARVLTGRYMGLLRTLPKAEQSTIKKLRATKGLQAAISALKTMKAKAAKKAA